MVRIKLIFSLLVITAFCAVAVPSFAKAAPAQVRGTYGFSAWTPEGYETDEYTQNMTGTMTVTGGWAGSAFGTISCNDGDFGEELTDYVATYFINPGNHQGAIFMAGLTFADEFCGEDYYLDLDAQVTQGGALIKFNFMADGYTGEYVNATGEMKKIFVGTPSGAYGLRLWGQNGDDESVVGTGWITLATDSSGNVELLNGEVQCNVDGDEYTSNLLLCTSCVTLNGDGTGVLFTTSVGGDDICGFSKSLGIDFVMLTKGSEIDFNADAIYFIPDTTRTNSGTDMLVTGDLNLQ